MTSVILEPLAGCIKFLPAKDTLATTDTDIQDGDYNHPVVILSPQVKNDGRVDILFVGSFFP